MITPDNERRVDTREFSGPVEVFSAFRSPEIPGKNLRVVMRRRGNTTPRLDWDGAQLRISTPTPGAGHRVVAVLRRWLRAQTLEALAPRDPAKGSRAIPVSRRRRSPWAIRHRRGAAGGAA